MNGDRIRSVKYSKNFLKSLGKLPERIIEQAEGKERIFKQNPFNSILRTHKLSGKEKDSWAFWINYSYRIKFIFLTSEDVLFSEIGKYDIYK